MSWNQETPAFSPGIIAWCPAFAASWPPSSLTGRGMSCSQMLSATPLKADQSWPRIFTILAKCLKNWLFQRFILAVSVCSDCIKPEFRKPCRNGPAAAAGWAAPAHSVGEFLLHPQLLWDSRIRNKSCSEFKLHLHSALSVVSPSHQGCQAEENEPLA